MNRKEFMDRLEKLLWNISDSEREEALQYYNDYFDDAGPENEDSVIADLVSPEQVAQKIKAGLSDNTSEFSEQGYRDTRFERADAELSSRDGRSQAGRGSQADGWSETEPGDTKRRGEKQDRDFWRILAIILLCILAAPVVLPVCGGILMAVLGIAVGVLAALVGVALAGFGILAGGIVVLVIGVFQAVATPPVGIALGGVGCILTAVGILWSVATVWCCVKLVPWTIRTLVGLIRLPFRKAGAGR